MYCQKCGEKTIEFNGVKVCRKYGQPVRKIVMKRVFKTLTAIVLILSLCMISAACTKTPTALTTEEFAAKAKSKGCEITESDSDIVTATYWKNDNGEVKFYVYDDVDTAKSKINGWYQGSRQKLYIGGEVKDSKLDPDHFEGYEINNTLYTFCLYRVDNTLLSIYTFMANEDDVQSFAKSIGYR